MNMAINLAAKDMKETHGVTLALLNPGFVESDMTADIPSDLKISTVTSAKGMFDTLVNKLSLDNSGAFMNYKGEGMAW